MLTDVERAIELDPGYPNLVRASAVLGQAMAGASLPVRVRIRVLLEQLFHRLPERDLGVAAVVARMRLRGELQLAAGDVRGALENFRKAANLDAPAGEREYLARGLTRAVAQERDAVRARQMKAEALQAYATVALRPGLVWHHPLDWPPGFYADELGAYLALATREPGLIHTDLAPVRARWRQMRGETGLLPAGPDHGKLVSPTQHSPTTWEVFRWR